MARTQTMVQLNEHLVKQLDAEASRRGISRSAVIREALEAYLDDVRARDIGRRIVDGYRSIPVDSPDQWAQLDRFGDTGTGELGQRLDAEERRAGNAPW